MITQADLTVIADFFNIQETDSNKMKLALDHYRGLFSRFDFDHLNEAHKTELLLYFADRCIKDFKNINNPIRKPGNPEKWDYIDHEWFYFDIEAKRRYKNMTKKDAIKEFLVELETSKKRCFPEIKVRITNSNNEFEAKLNRLHDIHKQAKKRVESNELGLFNDDFTIESRIEFFGENYKH